jgi:hypothetical protein
VNTFVLDYWARRPSLLTQESSDVIDWLASNTGQVWLNSHFRKAWGVSFFTIKTDLAGDCDSNWTASEIEYRWPAKGGTKDRYPELTDEDLVLSHPLCIMGT